MEEIARGGGGSGVGLGGGWPTNSAAIGLNLEGIWRDRNRVVPTGRASERVVGMGSSSWRLLPLQLLTATQLPAAQIKLASPSHAPFLHRARNSNADANPGR